MTTNVNELSFAIRIADAADTGDTRALEMLAELDEEPALSGEVLLALIDGEAVAAISLTTVAWSPIHSWPPSTRSRC